MGTREGHARPTIKDIAKAAGVGVVTVSRALNDKPEVSETTRAKVLAVAEKMGYRPNRHARLLKLSHNPAVALVVKGIDNLFFQQMLDTMETRVRERNYLLTLVKVPHWADEVEEAIKFVDEELIAGVIFLGGSFSHEAYAFERLRAPFVMSTVSRLNKVPDGLYSSVSVDDAFEAEKAVRHLIELGHTRIAVLGVPSTDVSVGAQRVTGYRHALAHAGIPVDEDLIRFEVLDQGNPYTLQYGYELAKKLLAERPEVTAIFAITDVLAIGAMRAIREAGLKVPENISLVGFDGLPLGDFIDPQLTTLAQPAQQIARLTCDLLFDQIASGPSRHVFVPGTLHRGGSTGPVRTIR